MTLRRLSGLVLMSLALSACDEDAPATPPVTPVRVVAVASHTPQQAQRYSANIQPAKSVNLAFKVNGYIKEIRQVDGTGSEKRDIQAGDPAGDGEVLAEVDPQQYDDQVKEAKSQLATADAALKKADADFKRATALYDSASMTAPEYDSYRKEYESAQASVNGAKAQLNDAQVNLGDTKLKAPMAGVILQRNIEVGSLVAPETVAFVIADVSSVKAVFGVPDVKLKQVKVGDPLSVTSVAYPGRRFAGQVSEIAPSADSSTRVFEVQVTLPNQDGALKAGMVVSLSLAGSPAEPVILVPLAAVVRGKAGPEAYGVFLTEKSGDKEVARLADVTLGPVVGNEITVTGGLEAGQRVIVGGATLVRDGQDVRVIP